MKKNSKTPNKSKYNSYDKIKLISQLRAWSWKECKSDIQIEDLMGVRRVYVRTWLSEGILPSDENIDKIKGLIE